MCLKLFTAGWNRPLHVKVTWPSLLSANSGWQIHKTPIFERDP